MPNETYLMSHFTYYSTTMFRQFIPFRKDEMKGTVVQLDRGSKPRGSTHYSPRDGNNRSHRDIGAVSGVIRVDKGPLIGTLVTFHRRYSIQLVPC